jgi:hypothetical protein
MPIISRRLSEKVRHARAQYWTQRGEKRLDVAYDD